MSVYSYRENDYFLLDLRLPKFSRSPVSNQHSIGSISVKKDGFVEMLQKAFKRDLINNNRYLKNPPVTHSQRKWKDMVHFCLTEIECKELPYCRRSCSNTKPGSLHAPDCYNATQETVEVLGQGAWINRVFLLDCYNNRIC